ncbi:hypothetical protein EYR40_003541 [Pleurotus pulmonarius]|nr:hypothetical protein EYR40_003541 [Pleurotus pulmonarius]
MPGPPGYNSYKRAVNNWAQENGKRLNFETNPSGLPSSTVWSCMITVDGIPGLRQPVKASNKHDAEEAAAMGFWGHRDEYA